MNVTGIQLMAAERAKQAKKYDAAHDDKHDDGSLCDLAAYLVSPMTAALPAQPWAYVEGDRLNGEHGADPIKRLVIGGALIAAEIDRRLRIMGTGGVVAADGTPPALAAACERAADFITIPYRDYRAKYPDHQNPEAPHVAEILRAALSAASGGRGEAAGEDLSGVAMKEGGQQP